MTFWKVCFSRCNTKLTSTELKMVDGGDFSKTSWKFIILFTGWNTSTLVKYLFGIHGMRIQQWLLKHWVISFWFVIGTQSSFGMSSTRLNEGTIIRLTGIDSKGTQLLQGILTLEVPELTKHYRAAKIYLWYLKYHIYSSCGLASVAIFYYLSSSESSYCWTVLFCISVAGNHCPLLLLASCENKILYLY